MQELAPGLTSETQRGPDWLFVRLHGDLRLPTEGNRLADRLWSLLQQHFTYRLVLEMDDVAEMRSRVLSQLLLLQKRIRRHGGMLRLSGLSGACLQALRSCRLDSQLPHYRNREEAVMGNRPAQPR